MTNRFAIAGHFVSYRWISGPHNFSVILWNLLKTKKIVHQQKQTANEVQDRWSRLNASRAAPNSFAACMFATPVLNALDVQRKGLFILPLKKAIPVFEHLLVPRKVWQAHGRQKRVAGGLWPPGLRNLIFWYSLFREKSLSFEIDKMKFHHCCPPRKNPVGHPLKNSLLAPSLEKILPTPVGWRSGYQSSYAFFYNERSTLRATELQLQSQ